MDPNQRYLQAKVKNRNEQKHVMPKSQELSRSLEISMIWTFDKGISNYFQWNMHIYYFQVCS